MSRMEQVLGLLKVKVVRGVNLAVRDVRASDPYVVVRMGKIKLKTHVIKRNVNPEWDEELTLTVSDPSQPIRVEVYDKDRLSHDDPMGDAEYDISLFLEAVKMHKDNGHGGSVICKLSPSRRNCLSSDSPIYLSNGKVMQDVFLRLRNVECGEVELQLQWVPVPSARGF